MAHSHLLSNSRRLSRSHLSPHPQTRDTLARHHHHSRHPHGLARRNTTQLPNRTAAEHQAAYLRYLSLVASGELHDPIPPPDYTLENDEEELPAYHEISPPAHQPEEARNGLCSSSPVSSYEQWQGRMQERRNQGRENQPHDRNEDDEYEMLLPSATITSLSFHHGTNPQETKRPSKSQRKKGKKDKVGFGVQELVLIPGNSTGEEQASSLQREYKEQGQTLVSRFVNKLKGRF